MFFKAFLITVSFALVSPSIMASSCNSALLTKNHTQGMFFDAGDAEFEIKAKSITVDDASDFANFYGSSVLIQDLSFHNLEKKSGVINNLFDTGYRLNTHDAIVLDEVCRQLTEGEYPYVSSEWTTYETVKPLLRRVGFLQIYTDRGGYLSIELTQTKKAVEIVKDLRCLKTNPIY